MHTSVQWLAISGWIGLNLVVVTLLLILSAFRSTPPITEQDF